MRRAAILLDECIEPVTSFCRSTNSVSLDFVTINKQEYERIAKEDFTNKTQRNHAWAHETSCLFSSQYAARDAHTYGNGAMQTLLLVAAGIHSSTLAILITKVETGSDVTIKSTTESP